MDEDIVLVSTALLELANSGRLTPETQEALNVCIDDNTPVVTDNVAPSIDASDSGDDSTVNSGSGLPPFPNMTEENK